MDSLQHKFLIVDVARFCAFPAFAKLLRPGTAMSKFLSCSEGKLQQQKLEAVQTQFLGLLRGVLCSKWTGPALHLRHRMLHQRPRSGRRPRRRWCLQSRWRQAFKNWSRTGSGTSYVFGGSSFGSPISRFPSVAGNPSEPPDTHNVFQPEVLGLRTRLSWDSPNCQVRFPNFLRM